MARVQQPSPSGQASPYPPTPSPQVVTIQPPAIEIPESVAMSEDADGYIFSFRLSRDEFDALKLFGLDPRVEVDGHVVRRAEAIMKQFASVYVNQCFNEQIPLDCFCQKELFRRYCKKRADVAPAI